MRWLAVVSGLLVLLSNLLAVFAPPAAALAASGPPPVFQNVGFAFSNEMAAAPARWTVSFSVYGSVYGNVYTSVYQGDLLDLIGPPGTVWPTRGGSYFVTTSPAVAGAIAVTASGSASAPNQVSLQLSDPSLGSTQPVIPAGSSATIQVFGVTNPPGGLYPAADFAVQLNGAATASPAAGAEFGTLTVTPSSVVAGAQAAWQVALHSPGALAAGSGTITIRAPVLRTSAGQLESFAFDPATTRYTVTDGLSGQSAQPVAVQTGVNSVTLTVAQNIGARDPIAVDIALRNPPDPGTVLGAFAVTVSSSPTVLQAPARYAFVSRQGSITASVSSTVNGAAGTTWTFAFPAESALAAGDGVSVITSGGGTFASGPQDYTLTVDGVQQIIPSAVSAPQGSGRFTLTLPPGTAIPALALLAVQARAVTNPQAAGPVGIEVATSGVNPGRVTSTFVFSPEGNSSATAGASAAASKTVHLAAGAPPLTPSTLPAQGSVPAFLRANAIPSARALACSTSWPFNVMDLARVGLLSDPTQAAGVLQVISEVCPDVSLVAGPLFTMSDGSQGYLVQSPTVQIPLASACGSMCLLSVQALALNANGTTTKLPTTQSSGIVTFTLPGLVTDVAFQISQFSAVCLFSCTEYTAPVEIVMGPSAMEQLDVMPFTILYQPPGDASSSSFSLSSGHSSTQSYALTNSQSNSSTTSTSESVSVSAGVKYGGFSAGVSNKSTWDQSTTDTTSSSSTSAHGITVSSATGQQWKSFTGGSRLDNPATPPWLFDEFVLIVHPQFAIWDGLYCPAGSTPQLSGGLSSCSNNAAPQGQVSYAMVGARKTYLDVSAGELLTCAQGTPLAIPGNYQPPLVLPPSECLSLLNLDPFAQAGTQTANPGTQLGTLATQLQSYYALPSASGGTNGSYAVTLSESTVQTVSSSSSSSFSAKVDDSFSNSTSVTAGYSAGIASVSVSGSFDYSTSESATQTVSTQQSQSSASTVAQAASATLADNHSPVGTTVWYDARWGTLMFQAPAAQVDSVSPSSGVADMQVSIGGSGFWTGPVGVQFCPTVGGGACTPASDVSAPSNDTVLATVPNLAPGTYAVQTLIQGATSTADCVPAGATGCNDFTLLAPVATSGASIDSLSPATGPDGGGSVVTINGAGLAGTQAVWFGVSSPQADPGLLQAYLQSGQAGPPAYAPAPAFHVVSDAEVVACAPAVSQAETVWVSVYSAGGWSPVAPASQFTYTAGAAAPACTLGSLAGPPVVAAVMAPSGPATGGNQVTIVGANFRDMHVPAACTAAGCPTGSTVTLLQPPNVEFCSLAGSPCVSATDVQVLGPDRITANAPPGVGVEDVRVGTSQGFSAVSAADRYTYEPAAACTNCPGAGSLALGASPPDVAATGTTSTTIMATVFNTDDQPVPGVTVQFSTSAGLLGTAQAVTDGSGVAEDTLIVPTLGPATVTATVASNPELENQTQADFTAVPVVTGISPSVGTEGTSVDIAGAGFTGATGVDFGSNPATDVQVLSDGEITALAPAGFGGVDVTVLNPGAQSSDTAADVFTYNGVAPTGGGSSTGGVLQPPAVTAISPSAGPASGGTVVKVTGSGFTGATAVDFGPNPGTIESSPAPTDSVLYAAAPPGTGTVDIQVVSRGGTSAPGSADHFTYLPLPAVTAVSPVSASLDGGITATIAGSGFTTASQVDFGGVILSGPAIQFVSDAELRVTVPSGGGGPVDVTVSASCGTAALADATACGTSPKTLADTFTYLGPPTVTGVSPGNGAVAGGSTVTLTGSGFRTATGVFFGSLPAQRFEISSDNQITAVTPAGSGGTVAVTVQTACGTPDTADATSCGTSPASLTAGDGFTFGTPPTVTAISPVNGPVAGGTTVTIAGTGFGSVAAVDFGASPAQSYTVNTAGTVITAVSPSASAGPANITVTAACGTAAATACGTSAPSGAGTFTFLPLPTVTGLAPAHGSVAGGSTVTLTGSGFTTVTAVDFGGVAATGVTIVSDQELTASVPADPVTAGGTLNVTVTATCATAATADATSCGTNVVVPADQFVYYPTTAQIVTRTLEPGWNTLSIPFPLAQGDQSLDAILGVSPGAPSPVLAAYAFFNGHWQPVPAAGERDFGGDGEPGGALQPMVGIFVMIGGSQPVTATMIPAGVPTGSVGTPSSPNTPPTLPLTRGWNLAGPSAPLGSEPYSDFLAGVETGTVPILIDPNGTDVPVVQPQGDTADSVQNGFAYWIYASQGDQSLVGQILTGPVAGSGGNGFGRGR